MVTLGYKDKKRFCDSIKDDLKDENSAVAEYRNKAKMLRKNKDKASQTAAKIYDFLAKQEASHKKKLKVVNKLVCVKNRDLKLLRKEYLEDLKDIQEGKYHISEDELLKDYLHELQLLKKKPKKFLGDGYDDYGP